MLKKLPTTAPVKISSDRVFGDISKNVDASSGWKVTQWGYTYKGVNGLNAVVCGSQAEARRDVEDLLNNRGITAWLFTREIVVQVSEWTSVVD